MMLDFVSTRYHVLPSKLLLEGSSIDYQIAQYAQEYQTYMQNQEHVRSESKINPELKMAPKLSQSTMQDMLTRARNG